ncbi:MAG: PQQ-binding-like beta-propeller repeat protein [Planctomycetota bacterium]
MNKKSQKHSLYAKVWLAISIFASTASVVRAETSVWKGFLGDGSASGSEAPQQIDASEQGNIAWRIEIPGRSVAGPVVAGDVIFTTSSSGPEGRTLWLTGVSLNQGEVLFEHAIEVTGRPHHHPTGAGSAPTPVTNGECFVAFYSSNDLVCVEKDGRVRWIRALGLDHPKTGNDLGMSSSPVIIGDKVFVLGQSQGNAFVHSVDLKTGGDVWQVERPRVANWASPLAVATKPPMLIVQGGDGVTSLNPETGETFWSLDYPDSTIPSPSTNGDVLMLPGSKLLAMDLKGYRPETGKIPQELFEDRKLSTSNASVALSSNRLYSLKSSILTAADSRTGEVFWKERLTGIKRSWATPLVIDDQIYVCGSGGEIVVIKDDGDSATVVSETELDGEILGSPAVADGRLLVRATDSLVAFE